MNFMHDEPPDTVYLSSIAPVNSPPPLALPDRPLAAAPDARIEFAPARRAAQQAARPSESPANTPAQRLAHLVSRVLIAPTEEEARHTVEDGVRTLVRCGRVVLRLLDDPPAALTALARPSAPDAPGGGAQPVGADGAWLRFPILADHEVIGTLALEAAPGQRALTPTARARVEMVAHALAQRLAHLRLLALAAESERPAALPTAPSGVPLRDAAAPEALRLAGACELMTDAVLIADEAGRVVAANSAFRHLFGLRRADAAPGVPSAPLLERARQSLLPLDPPVPIGPASASHPRRYLQRTPVRRVVERRVRTIHVADGAALGRMVTYRDITHAFDSRERQQRFLAAVAHELRTPLTGITGYAQLLLRELDRAEREGNRDTRDATEERATQATIRARVAALGNQSARMARLLRDMLDLTYLETGRLPLRLESVEMVRLVDEAIAAVGMATGSRHLCTRQAPRRLMLRGDSARIEQIVQHLLENAIKFSLEGSAIQVVLRTRRGADGVAWCVLRVRDAGAGVPAGWEEAIFVPFARPETAATRWISGIGLGLPLSRALAEQHGGTVRALAHQRTGATFELCLPLAGPGQTTGVSPLAGS